MILFGSLQTCRIIMIKNRKKRTEAPEVVKKVCRAGGCEPDDTSRALAKKTLSGKITG